MKKEDICITDKCQIVFRNRIERGGNTGFVERKTIFKCMSVFVVPLMVIVYGIKLK